MSEVYIHYGNLEDSIQQSGKVRDEISNYMAEIKRRITTPISDLPGSDSSGYASTAASLAWNKINALSNKTSRFVSYENAVSRLISTAKDTDAYVSNRIETISDMYIEDRNWFQQVGDAIYNFFCVDLANKWEFTRTISDLAKKGQDKLKEVFTDVRDWFKYGDGKYWANIGGAIASSLLSVAALIGAIVSFPVTGTAAMIIATVSLACAVVSTIITFVNVNATVQNNIKALDLSEDNPGAARYYGNVDSLSEEWNRTDMGGAAANLAYDIGGTVIDTAKGLADTGQVLCNIANLGVVKDFRFKPGTGNKGYSLKWDNIKRNLLHDMKIYTSKIGKKGVKWYETVNWKEAIDIKGWFGGFSRGKFEVGGQLVMPELVYKVLNITKIGKNTTDTIGHFIDINETINADIFKPGDLVEPIIDLVNSLSDTADKSLGLGGDVIDTAKDWGKWFKGLTDTPDIPDKETISSWFDEAGLAFGTASGS